MSGNPYASMHSKLMLLFHPNHLRIVVPTANFIAFDWGETGEMENSVFLIDLPRLPEGQQGQMNATQNDFSKELLRYVTAMGLDVDVISGLLNFDFSGANDIRFIHTIGGTFTGDAANGTGSPQLSAAIASLDLQTPFDEPLEVDLAASSIGALDYEQLDAFHRSLRGQPPVPSPQGAARKATASTSKKIQTTLGKPKQDAESTLSLRPPSTFRIMFPSVSTVNASNAGPKNAGTLFLPPEYFGRDSFPSDSVHEYTSRRKGLLSHSKLILARSPTQAFVYVGSHNLSQSAWGRRSWDRKAKQWKLTGVNWECGVVLPVKRTARTAGGVNLEGRGEDDISTASEDDETESEDDVGTVKRPSLVRQTSDVLPIEVFNSILDVPFEWPPKKYGKGELPWCAGAKNV